ncbi:hypothetical protein [Pleurocapsa sp. FMAR1]|uniref:hypothetical protein n=1 Tax=Pleurocapsa sp. FMAR1 TaxID=3040204 RepID=UPI0029C66720|nr:hypothetical protein [Pleurocapsa sp. FMAR1]
MERFAVAKQRRIAEGNRRIVHRVEDKLIKSKKFSLPGKKALSSSEIKWLAVIIDVGESPIERPKKPYLPLSVVNVSVFYNFCIRTATAWANQHH